MGRCRDTTEPNNPQRAADGVISLFERMGSRGGLAVGGMSWQLGRIVAAFQGKMDEKSGVRRRSHWNVQFSSLRRYRYRGTRGTFANFSTDIPGVCPLIHNTLYMLLNLYNDLSKEHPLPLKLQTEGIEDRSCRTAIVGSWHCLSNRWE